MNNYKEANNFYTVYYQRIENEWILNEMESIKACIQKKQDFNWSQDFSIWLFDNQDKQKIYKLR
jgi:hypothetical protein